MRKNMLAFILFIISSIIHLMSIDAEWHVAINFISKAMLMPVLAWYAVSSFSENETPYKRFIFSALAFSWLGDILLTWKEELFFLGGLSAFLIAHLFYIAGYYNETGYKQFNLLKQKTYLVTPYILIVGFFLYKTHANLGMMIIPVGIYSAVLATMSCFAMNRFNNVISKSFWITYIGSLLFMFSDFMIGWTVFYHEVPHSRLIIMATYIAGQFLIINGLVKQNTLVHKS
jgi:uncharacterized membrane protein YhhN